ncbi:MAG: pantetheine-phosphate adenylyltransferase [Clostridiales bacterium]|jgi:pantetheine-phosphate adenylyltransferase|nr:pantetheine-phosphate adenylyltransferase [Clostridiales bacterium]
MTAIFPGTFDPITNGHLDIIHRFKRLWPEDKLIIAIAEGENAGKKPIFTTEERLDQARALTAGVRGVEAKAFAGLLVEFARKAGARCIIRGLRNGTDFDYEMEMALINRELAPEIETIFIPAALEHMIISSSAVRQIAGAGGNADWMLPEQIRAELRKKSAKQ